MPAHSKRSAELDDRICERLANGDTLRQICRDEKISHTTIGVWKAEDEAFAKRIELAREVGYDAIADSCMEIADATDKYRSRDTLGKLVRDPQRDKLRVWTRLQLLSKWDPKRYGEKLDLKHSGRIGIEQLVNDSRKPDAE